MPIKVRCPHCDAGITAPDKAVGKTLPCPKCAKKFAVQAPPVQSAPVKAPPRPAPVQVDSPKRPPAELVDEDDFAEVQPRRPAKNPLPPDFDPNSMGIPNDGRPVYIQVVHQPSPQEQPQPQQTSSHGSEKVLWEGSPSMFRAAPIGFVMALLLCFLFVGIPVLAIWYIRCRSERLIVTTKRTTLQRGLIGKATNEVRHKDVRNIQVSQGFFQRMMGVGSIAISSAGQSDVEIAMKGITNPQHVASLIRKQQD